jgi:hypothetical protein
VCSNLFEILAIAIGIKKIHEEMEGHEDYADETTNLKKLLKNNESPRNILGDLCSRVTKVKETHDRDLEMANDFKTHTNKIVAS